MIAVKQKVVEIARVEKDVVVWKRREWCKVVWKVEERARMERDVVVWTKREWFKVEYKVVTCPLPQL